MDSSDLENLNNEELIELLEILKGMDDGLKDTIEESGELKDETK